MRYEYAARYTSDHLGFFRCSICHEKISAAIEVSIRKYDKTLHSVKRVNYCKHCISNIEAAKEYAKFQQEL